MDDATVRDYLITWLTDWVREFGIDGFRVDTAKHVEPEAWQDLKVEAQKALDSYRRSNPGQPQPAEDFWMVGEVFPHSVTRSSYFEAGFDAVINFDLQKRAASALLFTPGTSQIFYGDESGRRFGPTGSDGHQGTRSDMNWGDIENGKAETVLSHWKKPGQFPDRNPAIGAGEHTRISAEPYVFSRTHGDDRVVIAFGKE